MTHRQDVAIGRDIVARWCALAEQRLEYLTELFESGRWRRYHSELAFLENIQEAKRAVETWRELSTRDYARDRVAKRISRLSLSSPRSAPSRDRVAAAAQVAQRWPAPIIAEAVPATMTPPAAITPARAAPVVEFVPRDKVASAPSPAVVEFTLDIDGVKERYPLLRNVF